MRKDLFLFTADNSVSGWASIDDRVMGGLSLSRLRHHPLGHAVFEGTVTQENNGGFASVRSPTLDLGVPGAICYLLTVNGDGKKYKINLRTDDAFDGITYQSAFDSPVGVWTTLRLPVAHFSATWRGRKVPDAPGLDCSHVRQIGLMIADGQVGPFALSLRVIGSCA
jgi:hypothetical protein